VTLLGVNPSKASATTVGDGYIQWSLPAGTSVANDRGTLSVTFTAQASTGNVTVVQEYSWARSTAAKNGENVVLLQIFTPSGTNTFTDTISSITLQAQLTDGSTDVTSSATYQWAQWISGYYMDLSGKTASSLTLADTDVNSYASYRLTATYQSKSYVAYFSVYDKHDPIQVMVLSSVGTQIVNGNGVGALYVKVARNGQEADPIYSERFLTEDPAIAKNGDYYYKLDETNKTVTLRKYTTSWVDVTTNPYKGTYSWTWRDKDGNSITDVRGRVLPTQGKVIYIDGDFIDEKIIADVEVSL
jgi:hypothetical protein